MLMKMLHFYADHGDIQMTVSCLLTLEDKVKGDNRRMGLASLLRRCKSFLVEDLAFVSLPQTFKIWPWLFDL